MRPPAVHPLLIGLLRGADAVSLRPLWPDARDWTPLLEEAAAHGVTGLLHQWLEAHDAVGSLPVLARDQLEREVFGTAARNVMLAHELTGLLQAFEDHRLDCAPLRGLALAERLYGEVTRRPTGDLDLLVRKADLSRVTALLEARGFRPLDRRPGFARAFSYTLVFLKDRHGWLIVEPHWSLAYPPFVDRMDMAGVWARCRRGRVLGVETWLLGREDLILHLGLHLVHPDTGPPLLWVWELDRLLRREGDDVDWSRVVSLAHGIDVDRLLAEALATVRELFGTPIPEAIVGRGAAPSRRRAEGRLLSLVAGAAGTDGREELALFFSLRGVRARLRYAAGLLFPSRQFMRTQHGLSGPAPLAGGYLRRAARLTWAALKGMRQVFRTPSPG